MLPSRSPHPCRYGPDTRGSSRATPLDPSLAEHGCQGPFGHVVAGMAADRHSSRFGGMLELSVAASHDDAAPAVGFDQSDHVANIHCHNPNLISTQRRPVTRPETLATVPPRRPPSPAVVLTFGRNGWEPAMTCPSCSHANPGAARFCNGSARRSRRVATVARCDLRADVYGRASTARLAERHAALSERWPRAAARSSPSI
jgi:hypothetical protein